MPRLCAASLTRAATALVRSDQRYPATRSSTECRLCVSDSEPHAWSSLWASWQCELSRAPHDTNCALMLAQCCIKALLGLIKIFSCNAGSAADERLKRGGGGGGQCRSARLPTLARERTGTQDRDAQPACARACMLSVIGTLLNPSIAGRIRATCSVSPYTHAPTCTRAVGQLALSRSSATVSLCRALLSHLSWPLP